MFSNKAYGWKLGAALALVAGLGVWGTRRGDPINPQLWRCVVEPQRWDGTEMWIPSAQILAVRPGDFDIEGGSATIRVVGAAPAEARRACTIYGVFRADGPRFDLMRSRAYPEHARLRWLMEAVSVAVVLAVIANFTRHFLFRPKVLQVDGAD